MAITFMQTTEKVDWRQVTDLLNGFGLTNCDSNETKQAFENSAEVVFVWEENQIIGCGRALSDRVSQAAIYNIAVDEKFHGQGIGKKIIQLLVEATKQCNIVLYTHPDTITWYEEQGFKVMKTGMAIYHPSHFQEMLEMGFI